MIKTKQTHCRPPSFRIPHSEFRIASVAQSVNHGTGIVHLKGVVFADMLLELVHETAVEMNNFTAGGAFQVKMPVAAVLCVHPLVHRAVAAVRDEFFDLAALHQSVKTAVDGRLADFAVFLHKVYVNVIGGNTILRVALEILRNGLLLSRMVIAFVLYLVSLSSKKRKLIINFKFAQLLYHRFYKMQEVI